MKKRIRSAVLAFIIAAASLGGCSQSGKDTADASVIPYGTIKRMRWHRYCRSSWISWLRR